MRDVLPSVTRLRYVKASDADLFKPYLDNLGVRVQIYGAPVWTGEAWFLWFVPDDRGMDIPNADLTTL